MALEPGAGLRDASMTSADYIRTLDELNRLLNDPDVPLQPELIWCLLYEVAKWETTDRGEYATSPVGLPESC
jgi:hypothetical protein